MSDLMNIDGLSTYFFTEEGKVKAVDDVSFRVREGETVCIVGESGCGKSVTAMSIMGLVEEPGARLPMAKLIFRVKICCKWTKTHCEPSVATRSR